VTSPPDSSRDQKPAPVPKNVLITMAVILVGMAVVAIYANVQRLRRDKIETVIVTPIATPTPSASP
jgi:hypothetical protein